MEHIDLAEKFSQFSEHWRPKLVATLNGQEVKLAKFQGEFVWHSHEIDEMFLVWRGSMVLEMREKNISLSAGQFFVVPAGVEHRPVANQEVEVILFEPAGVKNTGDSEDSELTAKEIEEI